MSSRRRKREMLNSISFPNDWQIKSSRYLLVFNCVFSAGEIRIVIEVPSFPWTLRKQKKHRSLWKRAFKRERETEIHPFICIRTFIHRNKHTIQNSYIQCSLFMLELCFLYIHCSTRTLIQFIRLRLYVHPKNDREEARDWFEEWMSTRCLCTKETHRKKAKTSIGHKEESEWTIEM